MQTTCSATKAGDHTVTATLGGATGSTVLHVSPGPLAVLRVLPAQATMRAGASKTFRARGYDELGNAVGSETANVVFTISPNGSCKGPVCTARKAGVHRVSASIPSTQVSLGWDGHTCATASVGLECWGANFGGQVGDGTFDDATGPTPVQGLPGRATSIATGQLSTCAVAVVVECWGFDAYGVLGNVGSRSSALPLPATGLGTGSKVSSNLATCAIAGGGSLYCWGLNFFGGVGDGTTTDRWTPVPVPGLGSGVTDVSVGYLHACAVTAAGAAECWGNNWDGELGNGSFGSGDCGCLYETPAVVTGLSHGVKAITAGLEHTCALTTAGGVECWGDNQVGELGDGNTDVSPLPVGVQGLSSGVAQVSAGVDFTCVVTDAGGVECWGHGPLDEATGETSVISSPVDVAGLEHGVSSVVVGSDEACAVKTDGRIVCWQTGTTSDAELIPEPIALSRQAVLKVGSCVVPRLAGRTLARARRALAKAHCAVGSVRRVYSARVPAGRVLSQRPRHGRRLAFGARVNLVVSRGPRLA
jgi:alpha-tubulin suppressor-like RCC1 family protein